MVYRVFSEKKPGLNPEVSSLLSDCRSFLGLEGLTDLRILYRYDAEGLEESLFDYARTAVFSEPQLDSVSEAPEFPGAAAVFAVEPLPGQYDQRADSAAQCIQLLSRKERPAIRTARVYVLYGTLTARELDKVKSYVINPVESREASLEKPETLRMEYPQPETVETVEGFVSLDRCWESWVSPWTWMTFVSCRPISGTRRSGTPPSRRSGWWTLTGPTTAATPPSPPSWRGSTSGTRR